MTNRTLAAYEYILSAYGTALTTACGATVTTSKGYPVWGRPAMQTPCVALEVYGGQPLSKRVGQSFAVRAIGLRGWLFARNEPELCTMIDAFFEWHMDSGGAFEIAARRTAVELLELKRYELDQMIVEEAHAVTFLIQAIW